MTGADSFPPDAAHAGLRRYHAARWDELTVMELGQPGRRGVLIPPAEPAIAASAADAAALIPERARRARPPPLIDN